MTCDDVLSELKRLGTAQNRKIYQRHGVKAPVFGVSYAELKKLFKRLKSDMPMAEALWRSGNHDARILATMIANPEILDESVIDGWVQDLDNYVVTDAFSDLVGRTPFLQEKMKAWTTSWKEYVGAAGWHLLAHLAIKDDSHPDAFFLSYLKTIERTIHQSPNRTQYAMNNAVIAIGIRNGTLEKRALATAKRIGQVHVDHGQTSCKTPDAAVYIQKTVQRKKGRGEYNA